MSEPESTQRTWKAYEPDPPLVRTWKDEMAQGRRHLDRSAFELSLRSFANALQLCESNPSLKPLTYEVMGNIGWVNRLQGRYPAALKALQEALALADTVPGTPTMQRAHIEAELGTVYRLVGRLGDARDSFERQYEIGRSWEWKRVRCRAIGNLAMVNYQGAQELISTLPHDPDTKEKAKVTIKVAIAQLEERLQLAEEIYVEEKDNKGHGGNTRVGQAISWKSIALSRLALCYTGLADLTSNRAESNTWVELAVQTAEQGVELALASDNSAVSLSRLFYGRALLRAGRRSDALKQLNATTDGRGRQDKVPTCAISLCMEPSSEHRTYLREIVDVGADLLTVDPHSGYTALDYAVFGGDTEAEEMVLEGLRKQLLGSANTEMATKQLVDGFHEEARLRRGYREIFQEKLRPVLLKHSADRGQGNHHTRHNAISQLRWIYAKTLEADPAASRMFDCFKAIRYSDFVNFGRLPRSSDGLVRPLDLPPESNPVTDSDEAEFVIFFSYRWINQDSSCDSPDDADNTQYTRMVEAVEAYLAFGKCPVKDREKLFIWMDFACVNQDDPSSGVSALPIIITQCDLVITLKDDQYYERAWCCVEAMMIQTLQKEYRVHTWLEHVPLRPTGRSWTQMAHPSLTTVYNVDEVWWKGFVRKEKVEDGKRWELRSAMEVRGLKMKEKKLSYESDRPKVMFLERQTKLLGNKGLGDDIWDD